MFADEFRIYNYHLPYSIEGVFMVGWLDQKHGYHEGEVDSDIAAKLLRMIVEPPSTFDIHVNRMRGIHPCNLCGEDVFVVNSVGKEIPLGMSEIWIPGDGRWYAAPSLVVHYITEHAYGPPAEFLEAIREFDLASMIASQDVYDKAVRGIAEDSTRRTK